jgi:hypothetical protein
LIIMLWIVPAPTPVRYGQIAEDSGAFKTNQVNLRQIQHFVTIGCSVAMKPHRIENSLGQRRSRLRSTIFNKRGQAVAVSFPQPDSLRAGAVHSVANTPNLVITAFPDA